MLLIQSFTALLGLCILFPGSAPGAGFGPKPDRPDKPRLLVLTDISNEPDDEQSLVRLLVYANEFAIEGLVATTSTYLREKPREDLIRRSIAAYGEVLPDLAKHAGGYPPLKYIMEGDTPGFLGLIDNGLHWETSPSFGGWGGRYALYQPAGETRPIWTDNALNRDTVTAGNGRTETTNHATLWRWREHFQNDFAARMDWCIADSFEKANHNPRPVINGDRSTRIIHLKAKAGDSLKLSADGSDAGDPNQEVKLSWWIYQEAGGGSGARLAQTSGATTEVLLPHNKQGSHHIILQAEDDGTPRLVAYRRVVVDVVK